MGAAISYKGDLVIRDFRTNQESILCTLEPRKNPLTGRKLDPRLLARRCYHKATVFFVDETRLVVQTQHKIALWDVSKEGGVMWLSSPAANERSAERSKEMAVRAEREKERLKKLGRSHRTVKDIAFSAISWRGALTFMFLFISMMLIFRFWKRGGTFIFLTGAALGLLFPVLNIPFLEFEFASDGPAGLFILIIAAPTYFLFYTVLAFISSGIFVLLRQLIKRSNRRTNAATKRPEFDSTFGPHS